MQAELGTVRGDFGLGVDKNLCHGSDSLEAAEKEIELWFREGAFASEKEAPELERTFIMVLTGSRTTPLSSSSNT